MEIIGNISTTEAPITAPSSAIQNTGNTPSISADIFANIPTPSEAGRVFISTDTSGIFRDSGSSWIPLGGSLSGTANQITVNNGAIRLSDNPVVPGVQGLTIPSGTTAQRPASPPDGTIRFNTSNNLPEMSANPYTILPRFNGLTRLVIDEVRGKWKDDFLGGSSGSASFTIATRIGELGWNAINSTTAVWGAGVALEKHPGILNVVTSATNNSTASLYLGQAVGTGVVSSTEVEYFQYIVRLPTITSLLTRIGLGQSITTADMGIAGVFFQYNPAISANWQFTVRSSTSTTITTNVPLVANKWYSLEAFYTGTSWIPVINGIVQQTINTNLPSSTLNVGLSLQTLSASGRTLQVDYFSMHTVDLTLRY